MLTWDGIPIFSYQRTRKPAARLGSLPLFLFAILLLIGATAARHVRATRDSKPTAQLPPAAGILLEGSRVAQTTTAMVWGER